MRTRLSILMFLVYAIMGAWVPLFTLLLQDRQFTPQQTAWCCATSALGALLAPLPWGQVADRWLAAQRCISLCAFASGGCLFLLAEWTTPAAMFSFSLAHWFFMYPVANLATSLTFRHLVDPQRNFGPVRMWGTVGWIASGWLLGLWFQGYAGIVAMASWLGLGEPDRADSLRLGGILAALLGCYALTLPHTPPAPWAATASSPGLLQRLFDAPLRALSLLRQRSLAVLCACMFGLYITVPFYSQAAPLLLSHLGVSDRWLPVTLTIAQSLEVLTLWMLPLILLRLEEKGTLFIGMLAWAAAMFVMSLGQPLWLVVASLGLNGIYICCFIVAAQMFINRKAPGDVRASAQAMLAVINGMGLLIGHVLVGWLRDAFADTFTAIFLVPAILAITLALLFLATFRAVPEGASPSTA